MPNNRAFSLVSLSFLFAIFHVEGRLNGQNNQNTVFIIERPDDLTPSPFMNRNESIVPNLKSFAWSSCSGPDALAVINKLELSGPLSIPGNLTLTLNSYLQQSIKSPLKVAVKIYKKISFIWVDVPCLDNVGSCIYEDFCAVIPFTPGKPCPEPLEQLGFPCYCPLPQVIESYLYFY